MYKKHKELEHLNFILGHLTTFQQETNYLVDNGDIEKAKACITKAINKLHKTATNENK